MPQLLENPYRGAGLPGAHLFPRSDAAAVARLLAQCPAHAQTPLLDCPAIATRAGVARVQVKDERGRMGLGSFKALGASFAIAREAAQSGTPADWGTALRGRTFVTASAGNHT